MPRTPRPLTLWLMAAWMTSCAAPQNTALLPIPDRLVVLTFDDGNKSDFAYVAPLLQEYGFDASFYVTEGLGDHNDFDKQRYTSWDEVRRIHEMGFEIGNHTRDHPDMTELSKPDIRANLELIEQRCVEHGIPSPTTFVYPGWHHSLPVVEVPAERQYVFARRGVSPEFPDVGQGARGRVYDPEVDHPLLIPMTGYPGPDWLFEDLVWTVEQATDGKIAVLVYHGVPALDHPWVSTEPAQFVRDMDYLKEQNCMVIELRDLVKYADPTRGPADPYEPIRLAMGE